MPAKGYGTGGGGGPGGATGNVRWGPDFGGLDGDQFSVALQLALTNLALEINQTVGVQPQLTALVADYLAVTVGANVALTDVAADFTLLDIVGCNLDFTDAVAVYTNRVMRLNAVAGERASTPDSAALSVTGDLDIRAYISPDAWVSAGSKGIATKANIGVAESWRLLLLSTGVLRFGYTDATVSSGADDSTVAVTGVIDKVAKRVRVTLDLDNGAGGHDTKFWVSDGGAWTQLGATITNAGVLGAIQDITEPVRVGAQEFGGTSISTFDGDIHEVEIRNGIDGPIVGYFNPSEAASESSTSWVSSTGETWTLESTAALKNDTILEVGVQPQFTDAAAVYNAQSVGSHLAADAIGAPFWQAVGVGTAATGATSLNIARPSGGAVVGQCYVAIVCTNALGATVLAHTTPTGWTLLGSTPLNGVTEMLVSVFVRVTDGTEADPMNFAWTGGGSQNARGSIHRVIGAHATTPGDSYAGATVAAGAPGTPDPDSPTLDPTANNCLVFFGLWHDHLLLTQSHTFVAGYDERVDAESTGTGATLVGEHVGTRAISTGATGAIDHNCGTATGNDAVMFTAAIAPGSFVLAA